MGKSSARNPGFSRWLRWTMGLQVVVSAGALLAVVVMLNYLSDRHHQRFHWTQHTHYTLSPLTRQILGSLTNQVNVSVLFDPAESFLYTEVRALLGEYAAVSPRLEVEYVNFGRNKGRAEYLLSQYRMDAGTDSLMVVFDAGGRPPHVVREKELTDYDLSQALGGGPIRRVGFKGEQFFTSALLAMTDTRPVRAYALTGHGEASIENESAPEGYSRFAALLREKNVELHPLSLRTGEIPADCELLLVGGPRYPVPPDELSKVGRYLEAGGRALLLLPSPARPGVRSSGFEGLLAGWGVELPGGLVLDEAQSQAGDTRVLLAERFGDHPITRPLQGARLALIMPTAVLPAVAGGRKADETKVHPLVFTTEDGMIVMPMGEGRGRVETNGVIPVAVAVERGAIADVSPDRGVTRLVVVGESSLLGNQLIEFEANRDLGGLAANWLLDRQQLLHIGPRPLREYQLNLTRAQLHGAAWVLLGLLPGSALVIGVLVWLRRR